MTQVLSPTMPSPLLNGDAAAGRRHQLSHEHFLATVSEQRLRRLNLILFLFRVAAFCFSLTAAIFAATNAARSSSSPSGLTFDSFRFVFAANAIVAVYSLFEMSVSIWEMLKGATLLPEPVQLWFDFGHNQVFAYMAVAAGAAGATEARGLRDAKRCAGEGSGSFCVQADISIALGFAGFVFVAVSSLMSGFRVACYTVTGARSHL